MRSQPWRGYSHLDCRLLSWRQNSARDHRRFVADFARSGVRATRIVDSLDVVTRAPPSEFLFPYRHIGDPVYINANGALVNNPLTDKVDANLDLARLAHYQSILKGQLPRELTDHAPINYLRAFWPEMPPKSNFLAP